jgi:uncharacterized protein
MPDDASACLNCGACCAHFRVSFPYLEAVSRNLPESDLIPVSPHLVCFNGTQSHPVRCTHLDGNVGQQVSCRIYHQRPHPCREVSPGDDQCRKARAAHGLTWPPS